MKGPRYIIGGTMMASTVREAVIQRHRLLRSFGRNPGAVRIVDRGTGEPLTLGEARQRVNEENDWPDASAGGFQLEAARAMLVLVERCACGSKCISQLENIGENGRPWTTCSACVRAGRAPVNIRRAPVVGTTMHTIDACRYQTATQAVSDAIGWSVSHDAIVRIEAHDSVEAICTELLDACDGWGDDGRGGVEYWGTRKNSHDADEVDHWRVLAVKVAPAGEKGGA